MKIKTIWFAMGVVVTMTLVSCSKTQSYSELLRDEEKAVNWFLSSKNIYLALPENPKDLISVEQAGEEAPFYKLDADGYVYMQVVRADFSEPVDEGDLVYFRFNRQNISVLYQGLDAPIEGNGDYVIGGSTSFIYKNTYLSSSTTWGTGIQMPLKYMGYNSEVNLVLRSYYGFVDEQSNCIPYYINLKYFKPEY